MEAVRGGAGLLWESTVVKVYLESLHTLLRIQAGFIHTPPTVFFSKAVIAGPTQTL